MENIKIGDGNVLRLITENKIKLKTCIVIDSITVCNTTDEVVIDHICYDGWSIFILQESILRDYHNVCDKLFLIVRVISEDAHLCDYNETLFGTNDNEIIEIEVCKAE